MLSHFRNWVTNPGHVRRKNSSSGCIHVVAKLARGKERIRIGAGRSGGWMRGGREERGVETRQDRGVGGRMAVRIYGRFITLPALPRLL
ncbi:hypothetical protein ACS0PU_001493 [Formica fusca]